MYDFHLHKLTADEWGLLCVVSELADMTKHLVQSGRGNETLAAGYVGMEDRADADFLCDRLFEGLT